MLPPGMTPSSKKTPSHDPLADLDDDLGDDWESAFQAEDFMFSPEEESSDFFLFDENDPEKNADSSGLTAGKDKPQNGSKPSKTSKDSEAEQDVESSSVFEFPGRLQILTASLLQLFQARPLYQRLLLGSLPLIFVVIIVSTLFFKSTSEELASLAEQTLIEETPLIAPVSVDSTGESVSPQQQAQKVFPKQEPAVVIDTVQQKWKLPTFVIVAGGETKAELIVNVDITLIANLEIGQNLPADKQIFVKDIIYQFYVNRPAYELKRYALARGEMLSQLNAWLNKQWPSNPFDTIIFSRYQVTPTAPTLAPKVTFL
ncbi:MAG: hypothetical protein KKD73_12510 [Proteobacteria bacterium]|nr:hypothetical protein [Pseudomonadota bacterium]MBU1640944.1 hypothetical protein [Pseudomonadota bacterium]